MDILKSINHPDELVALFKFKVIGCESIQPKCSKADMTEDLKLCYAFLKMTSRSFAAVIQALDGELRNAVCIFYLVLRALDTVEDDMTIPTSTKVPMLHEFYTYLEKPSWKYMDSKEKDKMVLEQFPIISSEFRKLPIVYRDVIADICKRMGEGMVKYLDRSPDSLREWDEYCHFVAGLVGIGLSRLFSGSDLEDKIVGEDEELSNSMGLFLQKTNIIRDYLEDVDQGREFWPKEVWDKYCKALPELKQPSKRLDALACLNELVTNALQHLPHCIEYLARLKNQSVFNFCAIPQVMAIATLERCYNNYGVFCRVVKIRKGETVRLMMEATNTAKVKSIMSYFTGKIEGRIPLNDSITTEVVQNVKGLTATSDVYVSNGKFYPVYLSFVLMLLAIFWHHWSHVTFSTDTIQQ